MTPTITPLGDTAVTVTFGNTIDIELNKTVTAVAKSIRDSVLPGVLDVVPAYASLAIHYDPVTIGYRDIRARLLELIEQAGPISNQESPIMHTIPVHYNGEDLHDVASRTGLSVDDVIRIHSEAEYRVFIIGFVPGFAYLGPLDKRLVVPRRESPRKRVAAGSVAIAEAQTGVYPSETPGGWHLIGSTDVKLFDPHRQQPSLLAAGDRVKFERIA